MIETDDKPRHSL